MKTFKSINPFDRSVFAEHPLMTDLQLDQALQLASQAFAAWRKSSYEERSQLLVNLAEVLRAGKEGYALTIAMEMGKVLQEARN
ncbi:MAG: aldehyde dehydrogenase family protein, partial [Chitinophagales bacterium]|nr:aldehyde dehydrogenase family protein [Chitinophagales bacterium]